MNFDCIIRIFWCKTHLTMSMIVLFFHHFTDLYFHCKLFCYCHQLLSYVFSNENSIMQYLNLGKAVLRPPFQASLSGSTWYRVCLYLNLLLRWSHYRLDVYSLPLCQAFLCIASAGLFSLYLLSKAFSVFCLLWVFVMLSVGWQYLQSCSLVVCAVLAGYAGYLGYALPEARVRWVCWGDCRGSLWAIGRPPEGSLGCRVASLGCMAVWRVTWASPGWD